jgi:uncharacterized integral membrane protein
MAEEVQRGKEKGLQTRGIAVAILIAVGALFAVLNLDEAKVNWIVTTTETPIIVVILVSAAIGLAVGWFVGRRRTKA